MAFIHPEAVEQIKVMEFVIQCTDLPIIYIKNEGNRSRFGAWLAKRMGLCTGVCDLLIPRATTRYHGLFLELKLGKGKVSDAQAKFMARMNSENYLAIPVWGAEAAIAIIKSHYKLK